MKHSVLLVLLLVVGLALANEAPRRQDQCLTANGNSGHYNNFVGQVNQQQSFKMKFKAKASNDIHVAFISGGEHRRSRDAWEIVLGGWGNSRSVIRHGTQGRELTAVRGNVSVGDANTMRKYWITYDAPTETLSVWDDQGEYNGPALMSAKMPALSRNDLHVAMGAWDTPVKFCNVKVRLGAACYTVEGNGANYNKFVGKASQQESFRMKFQAKANNDVHIAFIAGGEHRRSRDAWEIVLGGWGNSKSAIRHGTQGRELVAVHGRTSVGDRNTVRKYWITYDSNRETLSVWDDQGDWNGPPMMEAKVPTLSKDDLHVAVGAWDSPVKFCKVKFLDIEEDNAMILAWHQAKQHAEDVEKQE